MIAIKRTNAHEFYGKKVFFSVSELKEKEEELRAKGYVFVRKGNRRKIKPVKGNFHGIAWGLDDETKVLVYYYTGRYLVFQTYYSLCHLW
jgi:hypothetical protein